MDWLKKYWVYIVLGIFAVNSLILDLSLSIPKSQSPQKTELQNYCSQGCIDQINLTFKSQKENVSPVISPTTQESTPSAALTLNPTPTATPLPTPTPIKTVKEFFVPLGTGTGKPADWTVVDGMGAKIDPSDYGDIKQTTFEVTAKVPAGNQQIWIRLYNANTYQAVAGSEVTLQAGGTAALLTSAPISLTPGDNLYQIQMKTQLQADTNINMSRIRIKTN